MTTLTILGAASEALQLVMTVACRAHSKPPPSNPRLDSKATLLYNLQGGRLVMGHLTFPGRQSFLHPTFQFSLFYPLISLSALHSKSAALCDYRIEHVSYDPVIIGRLIRAG